MHRAGRQPIIISSSTTVQFRHHRHLAGSDSPCPRPWPFAVSHIAPRRAVSAVPRGAGADMIPGAADSHGISTRGRRAAIMTHCGVSCMRALPNASLWVCTTTTLRRPGQTVWHAPPSLVQFLHATADRPAISYASAATDFRAPRSPLPTSARCAGAPTSSVAVRTWAQEPPTPRP